MAAGVDVDGVTELVARLDHARAGIVDLSAPNADMARMVEGEAGRGVPRASGRLAASAVVTVTGTGWGVAYREPYAMPVHFGTRYMRARPWLTTAATRTEERWMDTLTEYVQQLLD